MTEEKEIHRVFLNKPAVLINNLFCRVVLKTQRGSLETGGLLAIDPVSDSAIIANDGDDDELNSIKEAKIVIVPFVDWTTLKVINDSEKTKTKYRKLIQETQWSKESQDNFSAEELSSRRDKVKDHLSKFGVVSKLEGENIVIGDTVIIQPPYSPDCCDATNEIILARIKNILENFAY